jgi:hypothetical protein
VGHLQENGYTVDTKDVNEAELVAIKQENGVPRRLHACHTGIVEGYVIEGHVPADVIDRLLKEDPAIQGIAVPGMPMGSPGMEGPRSEPYNVVAFDKDGRLTLYERR